MLKRIWELCRKKLALYYVPITLLSVSGVFALPLLFSGIEKNNLGLVIAVIVAEVLIVTFSRAVNARTKNFVVSQCRFYAVTRAWKKDLKPTEISAASSKSDHIAMLFTSDIPMFVQMLFTTGSVLIGLTMYGSIIAITVIAALVLSIAVQHYATKEMSRLNDEWMGLADITQETILRKDEDRYKAYLERSMTNAIGFSQVDSYTWLFQGTLIGIVSVSYR